MTQDKAVTNEFQPSLSEWFKAVGGKDDLSEAVRNEDNTRTARFDILHADIHLPVDQPVIFEAVDLLAPSLQFQNLLTTLGDKPCAIRLIPKKDGLPKLRDRGLPLRECYEKWFLKQAINHADYLAEVYRHSNTQAWAATFVVKSEGVVGEIVQGLHTQLTHGEIKTPIYRFLYNFSNWEWSEENTEAKKQVESMLASIIVPEKARQQVLREKLNAEFCKDFIKGYFETSVRDENELIFIDYNRLLPDHIFIPDHIVAVGQSALTGLPASPGTATGKVVFVTAGTVASALFADGDILVCDNTDVRYLPLMKRAGAIVTERGGILSHAAIVAREMKKPCVVGVKSALKMLENGQILNVNGGNGIIQAVL